MSLVFTNSTFLISDAQTSTTFNPFIVYLVSIDYFFTIETNIYTTDEDYKNLKKRLRYVIFMRAIRILLFLLILAVYFIT